MFFLLRSGFWICLLLLVLPFGDPKGTGPSADERASIDAMSALAAAGATVSDIGGFCARQPEACSVGTQALKLVGERAATGAAAIQDYLGSEPATPGESASAGAPGSRGTLTATDRKPVWRGPA